MAEETLTLYQKLAKIRKLVDVVKKDKDGYKFKYADVNEILAKVKGGMEKYGISLIPEILSESATVSLQQQITKKVQAGSVVDFPTYEYLFSSDMTFTWVNDTNPDEKLTVPWHVVGSQADPSQAYGSALTYCTRYFLLNFFQIAQDNDVDEYRRKQREAHDAEEESQAAAIIKAFDTALKTYLSDHQDKRDDLIAFVKRYTKDGKYQNIKEPILANKMMEDFRANFLSDGSTT